MTLSLDSLPGFFSSNNTSQNVSNTSLSSVNLSISNLLGEGNSATSDNTSRNQATSASVPANTYRELASTQAATVFDGPLAKKQSPVSNTALAVAAGAIVVVGVAFGMRGRKKGKK